MRHPDADYEPKGGQHGPSGPKASSAARASIMHRADAFVEDEENDQMIYSGMKFPEYVYRPFPKWITARDGSRVIVHSEEEMLKRRTELPPNHEPSELERDRDDLAEQLAAAQAEKAELEAKLARALGGDSAAAKVPFQAEPIDPSKPIETKVTSSGLQKVKA